jgi:hypothetical protein
MIVLLYDNNQRLIKDFDELDWRLWEFDLDQVCWARELN